MKKTLTNKEYEKYVEKKSPKSKIVRNVMRAFIVGGFICIIGQFITNTFKSKGLDTEVTAALTAIILVFAGALLTGLDLYDDIGKFAGAGSIVPITGFANSIVAPAIEFKSEGYVMGVGARMFAIAGPVLVYGITASVVSGIIYYLVK